MNKLILTLLVPLTVACSTAAPALFDKKAFHASVDGKQVELYTLQSSEITLKVTNYGGGPAPRPMAASIEDCITCLTSKRKFLAAT